MPRPRSCCRGLVVLLSSTVALASFAAESATNAVVALSPVLVEASRLNESAEHLPNRVEVYTGDQIAAAHATSLADFLSKRASLMVRTLNANPTQTQLSLRGYGENSFGRCKVIVDGEELNSVEMEAPNLFRIPIDQIERIEILRGPQTVLHGDSASAGVVNIVTAKSYDPHTKLVAKGGSEGTFGASVSRSGGDRDAGVTYKAGYDYLRSDGSRANSRYETHNIVAGLQQNFANGSFVGLHANYSFANYQMPGSLTEAQYKRDRTMSTSPDDWALSHNYSVGLESKLVINDETSLFTDLNYAQKNRHVKWGSYGYSNDYGLYSVRLNPRVVNESPIGSFANRATFGLDLAWDHYDVKNGSSYLPPNPFFDRYRLAAYGEEEFFVTDELSVLAGLRGEQMWNEWQRYSGLTDPRQPSFNLAYEVGLVYRPVQDLKTYVKQTRFYRAPFCDEMNYVESGTTLDPESGYSVDFGAEWTFASEWNLFFDGYGTWTQDEIFYNPYHTPTAWGWSGYNCNSPSDTQRLGFDTGLVWERKRFAHALVKYGYVDARFLDGQYENCEVPLVPSSQVRAEVGYWLLRELELRLGYRYLSEQRYGSDFLNEAGRFDASHIFDLAVTYAPERWGLEGLKLTLTIDNLFDERTCDYAGYSSYTGTYYYPAAGRTFLITLAYEF